MHLTFRFVEYVSAGIASGKWFQSRLWVEVNLKSSGTASAAYPFHFDKRDFQINLFFYYSRSLALFSFSCFGLAFLS